VIDKNSLEPTLSSKFEAEKLIRKVLECNDINTLREISLHLIELNQKKSAIISWATKRAFEAEKSSIFAENNSSDD
tara:strand:- start:297 stop:524 length:228 start_codon:yes stop_codon:yes gene_type:complete